MAFYFVFDGTVDTAVAVDGEDWLGAWHGILARGDALNADAGSRPNVTSGVADVGISNGWRFDQVEAFRDFRPWISEENDPFWAIDEIAPATATLIAGDFGGLYDGYCGDAGWGGATWGSLSDTSAPGGETITALHWDAGEARTYLVIPGVGAGKNAWFTGKTIYIDGTPYTFSGVANAGGYTYAGLSPTKLFTSGNSYSISWTAPGGDASANGATVSYTASLVVGAASAASQAAGATLSTAQALIAGAASAASQAAGQTVSEAYALIAGAASGASAGTANGATVPYAYALLAGIASGGGAPAIGKSRIIAAPVSVGAMMGR